MNGLFRIAAPEELPGRIALAPVYNALNSMALLHQANQLPGVAGWVKRTAATLTPDQLRVNRLIFDTVGPALLLEGNWSDMTAYLEVLATQRPETLRDRALAHYGAQALAPEAETLLADPFRMHDLLVAHLRELWETHLEAEWAQSQRSLQHQVAVLSSSIPSSGVAPTVILRNLQTFIAREAGYVPQAQEVVFVPSPHTGRYITQLLAGSTLYLFFDVEIHTQVLLRDTPVRQEELIGRISALTEPARLRVLTLLAQHGELSLQDLMAQLETSQPNVSRYLKSLGYYVEERRGKDGRKRYRLKPIQLDLTYQALKQTILTAPAPTATPQEELMHNQGLTRFIDAQGAVKLWPGQAQDQRNVLTYLAERFAPDQMYSEKEVNALLSQYVHPYVCDHVAVRRDLIDLRLLQRSKDGARYWRGEGVVEETLREISDEEAYKNRYLSSDSTDSIM